MIILTPKMQFGVPNENKSLAKAKRKLMSLFTPIKQKEDKNYSSPKGIEESTGNKFLFEFELDRPIGIGFKDLYEIYHSIPKNLLKNYEKGVKLMDKVDTSNEKGIERLGFMNMKISEFENFIETYLNNLRKESENRLQDLKDNLAASKKDKK